MNTSSKFIILIFLSLNFLPVLHAGSTIYKYVDKDGNITFTNRPLKGGQKILSAPKSPSSRTYISKAIKHIPKESVNPQNKREIKRREILEHELTIEMKLFSDTRKNLSVFSDDDADHQQNEKIKQLQRKLLRHENNITAIKKELAKL
ncbi:MAG: DUF4124 domain-containing protein [Burkholderiales bacterium]|nr:DUF4124 domain-containing protein [Nitrosomonas sp.]MCP5276509.1 DUF4124 domain-containing protein [Burkholderiales bacterium]